MIIQTLNRPWLRWPLFIVLFAVGYAGSTTLPLLSAYSNLPLVGATISSVFSAINLAGLSDPKFAYALASAMTSVAAGLILAFGSVVLVRTLAISQARRLFSKVSSPVQLVEAFELIDQKASANPVIGLAWSEFRKTSQRGEKAIENTVRPQAYINSGQVRDGSFALKMMSSMPGYFVGIGLLLTFIGLVIALSKAAEGTSGGDAATMTQALRELLNAATFKFSTSIAGLFASIVLSFIFKLYSVSIESALAKLNREIERVHVTLTPQSISQRIARDAAAQLAELKEINTDKFFQRMGEQIAPQIKNVIQEAFQPLTDKLDQSVGRLEDNSQRGVEGLITRFQESLTAGAGTEMREIAGAIQQTREALTQVQTGLQRATDAFGARMDTSVERFASVASEAREQFMASNAEGLSKLQVGVESVLGRVQAGMDAFQQSLGEYQKRIGEGAADAAANARAASEAAAKASNDAVQGIAKAMNESVGAAIERMNADVTALSLALQRAEKAFTDQMGAMRDAVSGSGEVATSFRQVASDVGRAAAPLIQSSSDMRASSEALSSAVTGALSVITQSQDAARILSENLIEHTEKIRSVWDSHEQRFAQVDTSLAAAVATLSNETDKYAQNLKTYVLDIDKGCADAVARLSQIVNDLKENAGDLNENFEALNKALSARGVA